MIDGAATGNRGLASQPHKQLFKSDADPKIPATDDTAIQSQPILRYDQRERCGKRTGVGYLQPRAADGDVANCTGNLFTSVLYRRGLGDAVAGRRSGFNHGLLRCPLNFSAAGSQFSIDHQLHSPVREKLQVGFRSAGLDPVSDLELPFPNTGHDG